MNSLAANHKSTIMDKTQLLLMDFAAMSEPEIRAIIKDILTHLKTKFRHQNKIADMLNESESVVSTWYNGTVPRGDSMLKILSLWIREFVMPDQWEHRFLFLDGDLVCELVPSIERGALTSHNGSVGYYTVSSDGTRHALLDPQDEFEFQPIPATPNHVVLGRLTPLLEKSA